MKWYWQIYCGLLLLLSYGQLARKLMTDTGGFSSRYSAAIIATVIVVMLMAQAKQIALGKVWIWQILFTALSLAAVVSVLFIAYLAIDGVWISAGILLIATIALAPALLQIFQYGFRSLELWR